MKWDILFSPFQIVLGPFCLLSFRLLQHHTVFLQYFVGNQNDYHTVFLCIFTILQLSATVGFHFSKGDIASTCVSSHPFFIFASIICGEIKFGPQSLRGSSSTFNQSLCTHFSIAAVHDPASQSCTTTEHQFSWQNIHDNFCRHGAQSLLVVRVGFSYQYYGS